MSVRQCPLPSQQPPLPKPKRQLQGRDPRRSRQHEPGASGLGMLVGLVPTGERLDSRCNVPKCMIRNRTPECMTGQFGRKCFGLQHGSGNQECSAWGAVNNAEPTRSDLDCVAVDGCCRDLTGSTICPNGCFFNGGLSARLQKTRVCPSHFFRRGLFSRGWYQTKKGYSEPFDSLKTGIPPLRTCTALLFASIIQRQRTAMALMPLLDAPTAKATLTGEFARTT